MVQQKMVFVPNVAECPWRPSPARTNIEYFWTAGCLAGDEGKKRRRIFRVSLLVVSILIVDCVYRREQNLKKWTSEREVTITEL